MDPTEPNEDTPLEMHCLFAQGDSEIYRCGSELWFVRRSTWKQTLILVWMAFFVVCLGGIAVLAIFDTREGAEPRMLDPVPLVVFVVVAAAVGGFTWARRNEIRRGPPERLPKAIRTDRATGELVARQGWRVALEEIQPRVTKMAYGSGHAYTVSLCWPGATWTVLDASEREKAESARATIDAWLDESSQARIDSAGERSGQPREGH